MRDYRFDLCATTVSTCARLPFRLVRDYRLRLLCV